jgi:transcriptional regulator with XRE-family HTH domain
MAKLRNRLREIRELRGLTQVQLAKLSGVGVNTISRYERQVVKQYDADVLLALGRALKWEPNLLLVVEDD